jgi:hypothetical protein
VSTTWITLIRYTIKLTFWMVIATAVMVATFTPTEEPMSADWHATPHVREVTP